MKYQDIKKVLSENWKYEELTVSEDRVADAVETFNTNDIELYSNGGTRTNESMFITLQNAPYKCREVRSTYNGEKAIVLIDANDKIWAVKVGFKWIRDKEGYTISIGDYYFSPSFNIERALEKIEKDINFYHTVVAKDPNFTRGT
jgi:hypothetical protein